VKAKFDSQIHKAVFITSLQVEYEAVRAHLENIREVYLGDIVFEVGFFSIINTKWEIYIIELGVDNPNTYNTICNVMSYFEPTVAMFVGLSSGSHVNLGDVVIGTQLLYHNLEKTNNPEFTSINDSITTSYNLQESARKEMIKDAWINRIPFQIPKQKDPPKVKTGHILLSGSAFSNPPLQYFFLRAMMEGGEFIKAIQRFPQINMMVVCGISQLLTDSKIDSQHWDLVAAHNAAAFAYQILANYSLSNMEYGEKEVLLSNPDIYTHHNLKHELDDILNTILTGLRHQYFDLSISRPKFVSKKYTSRFLVQLYFKTLSNDVKTEIKKKIGANISEDVFNTKLTIGRRIRIKLYSPDIKFGGPVIKTLDAPHISALFLGKPLDTCQPCDQDVVVSLMDDKTGVEIQADIFIVHVVDYAFDHFSRPLLLRVSSIVLGIGSFATFILTFLEQIDKTIGLTSGTAAGILATFLFAIFHNLYQRLRPST
jgi:nucleoside phosphorylase